MGKPTREDWLKNLKGFLKLVYIWLNNLNGFFELVYIIVNMAILCGFVLLFCLVVAKEIWAWVFSFLTYIIFRIVIDKPLAKLKSWIKKKLTIT